MDWFDDDIAELYRGWRGEYAHPDSPNGGGSLGQSRMPGPFSMNISVCSRLPHTDSPAARQLIPQDIATALHDYFSAIGKSIATGSLKLDLLKNHVPDDVLKKLSECIEKFHINTPLRLAHFLAQCSHESGGFKRTRENLNYSADGLKKTFPKYFPDDLADEYARKPEKIAARVYGGRMGNGDEKSKEGYKYRGRGYIQLTGKNNYRAFDKTVNDDILSNPDLVADKYPLLSAA